MASGSSGRDNSGSKGFDFGSDDILCSYEDYVNQETFNGAHSEPGLGTNSPKEVPKSRMGRSHFPASSYSPPEESSSQDVIVTVEKTMKKYADNLMRFLEGISSRLSQLELYCYNLDKSIGEMRSTLVRDHGDADSKLKSLEKHVQEVHRSVQILRDKQELAETQKELAKLQLAQKESASVSHSQQNEERVAQQTSEPIRIENTTEVNNQQLALALPHQVASQPSLPNRPVEQQQPMAPVPPPPPQSVAQPQSYYLPPAHIQNPAGPTQPSQGQYLPPDSQYGTPQMQDMSRVAQQPTQSQVNQTPQIQPLPQFQQQWSQQLPQQGQAPQQPSMQPQMRHPSPAAYPPYMPSQPANPSVPETLPSSMPMQVPFSGISQPGASRSEAMPYGYSGTGRLLQLQPPPQQLKPPFGMQTADGYSAAGAHPHPTVSPGNAYMMYEGEGGRIHHPSQQPQFPQGSYPPPNAHPQNPQPNASANHLVRPPQFMRNHPYNELIEKLVGMGFRGDHVVSEIQRLEENCQTVDFNAVLDRLNVNSSGGSQRGWSG